MPQKAVIGVVIKITDQIISLIFFISPTLNDIDMLLVKIRIDSASFLFVRCIFAVIVFGLHHLSLEVWSR